MSELIVFSQPWAEAFGQSLRSSRAYREAASTWEGTLVFSLGGKAGPPVAAVYADLWHGECREARAATAADLESAAFVIRGDSVTWRRVLDREIEPLFAIISGRLVLDRGRLGSLLPFAAAARELVACASAVGGLVPRLEP